MKKTYVKGAICLLTTLVLLVGSCVKTEGDIPEDQSQIDLFTTASIEETLNFYRHNKSGVLTSARERIGLQPDLSSISQETLTDTDQQVTVVNATT